MRTETITAGKRQFIVTEADAQSQLELMTLLSAQSTYTIVSTGAEQVDVPLLVGLMTRWDLTLITRVAHLCIKNVREVDAPDVLVDVKTFQGDILSYYKLIAEAVKMNLDDFFTYILSAQKVANDQAANQTTV